MTDRAGERSSGFALNSWSAVATMIGLVAYVATFFFWGGAVMQRLDDNDRRIGQVEAIALSGESGERLAALEAEVRAFRHEQQSIRNLIQQLYDRVWPTVRPQ